MASPGSSVGDLADQVAAQLTTDTAAPVAEAAALTEDAALSEEYLFTKIRFSWRPEDRAILDRIRASADAAFERLFASALGTVDRFYAELYLPETDANGMVRKDAQGRPVWQLDEQGSPLEDVAQLTGQDIDTALLELSRLMLMVAPQVTELFLEALYARNYVATDIHDDTWTGIMDGTQGDKNATSNKANRVDRYHAFHKFYLWKTADTFAKEITLFMRRIEKIRDWRQWDK